MLVERVVCLVSGGIDSPVACALAARGFEVVPVHFALYPYTCEDNFYVAVDVLRVLKRKTRFARAFLFPWSRVLRCVLRQAGRHACVLCRRGMLMAAELLCDRVEASGIVTGESLGQKASQTLQNLQAVSAGIRYPILRPLLAMDKLEIERLAKQLGLWRETHASCCYATPRRPRTAAKRREVNEIEARIGLRQLVEREMERIVELKTLDEDLSDFLESLAAT